MQINLFLNATTLDATKDMISTIDNSDFCVENIIIVPDKFSLQMEKLALSMLPRKAFFNVKVVGITTLVNDFLKKNGVNEEVLSNGESLILVAKAIENVKGKLISFKKNNIDFCYEIDKLISQFKSCLVGAEDLNEKANGLAGIKYHDLKIIYQEYENLRTKFDVNSRLQLACEMIKNSNTFENAKLFFAQFDAFTAEGYMLIKSLMKGAKQVNVSLARAISIGNEYIYEKDIFQKLVTYAKEEGCELVVKDSSKKFSNEKTAILSGVMSYQKVKCQNKGFYTLVSASNLQEEANVVAKTIYNLVLRGLNYKDIIVLTSDIKKYKFYIENELNKFEIPHFIDDGINASETILVNLIYAFFNVVLSGYTQESLISLFANILVGEKELISKVQSFMVDNRFKYKRFIESDFQYSDILVDIERSKTSKQFSQVIKNIVNIFKDKYDKVLDMLSEKKYLKEKNINDQIAEVIEENLKLIEEYENEISLSQYHKRFDLLLSFKTLSTVPTFVDGVFVGDATTSSSQDSKIVILMGGHELPITSQDNGLLTDEELYQNFDTKVIEPTIRMINRRNRFKIFELLSKAQDRLIITYQVLSDDGKKNEIPTFISSLNEIFMTEAVKASDAFYDKKNIVSYGNRKNFITENYFKFTNEEKQKYQIYDDFNLKIDKKTLNLDKKGLFFKNNKASVTQIEQYFSCPFKHFVSYGLKLKENETCTFEVKDIGNICHRGAELFVKKIIEKNFDLEINIDKFIEENFYKILKDENLEEKFSVMTEKNTLERYLKNQIKSILQDIIKDLKVSSFRPKYLEMRFENITLGEDNKIGLIGKADRIDECGDYIRIIDYKTGSTGNILKELYYGNKLQLFLYQKVASEGLKKKGAGVFYFNAKFDYEKSEGETKILKGIVENDEDIIPLMDSEIDKDGKSDVLSVSLAGQKSESKYKGSAVAKDKLKAYENYAVNVASKAIDEIVEGFIQPKPDEDACKYCPYAAICMYEKTLGVRSKENIGDFN